MKNKFFSCVLLVMAVCVTSTFSQDQSFTQEEIDKYWKKFTAQGWHKIDYSKTLLTQEKIAKIDVNSDDEFQPQINELALLRGVIFGKRGRIFKSINIQKYLESQDWYQPNKNFSNHLLTKTEKANLDLIRLAEAEQNDYVQPGDLRLWQKKEIPDKKIGNLSPTKWRIIIAEIEAIHGRRFDNEPWLQKYFDERYWYQPNNNYSSNILNEFERKNLEKINAERKKGRNISVSLGDMDKFQNAPLTKDMLKGLTLNELRMIRNEFFARNGYKFSFPGIAQNFEWREWYQPLEDQSRVKLNEIELKNVKLIERVEKDLRQKIATELIDSELLDGLFIEDLRVLRNEIYARRGRVFSDTELQNYFSKQKWYQPNPDFKDEMLSEIEAKNLKLIKEAEDYALSKLIAFEG